MSLWCQRVAVWVRDAAARGVPGAPSAQGPPWRSSGSPGGWSWEWTSREPILLFISSSLDFNCISFVIQPVCSYCFLHRDCSSNTQLGKGGPSPFDGLPHSDCFRTVGRLPKAAGIR